MSLLKKLIEEDFGFVQGNGVYSRSEDHDSLVYNEELDLFYWNSRGIYGGVFEYLTDVRGLSKKKAYEFIRSASVEDVKSRLKIRKEERPSLKTARFFYNNIWECDRTYYYRRGLDDRAIKRYLLGCYKNSYGVFYTVPLFDRFGNLSNIQMRTESDSNGKKIVFKFYKIGRPSIWNESILDVSREVFFAEGLLDGVLLSYLGLPAISTDSSLNFHETFYEKFSGNTLYVIQDNDRAGMKEATRLLNKLGREKIKILSWKLLSEIYSLKVESGEDVISLYQKIGNDIVRVFSNKSLYV